MAIESSLKPNKLYSGEGIRTLVINKLKSNKISQIRLSHSNIIRFAMHHENLDHVVDKTNTEDLLKWIPDNPQNNDGIPSFRYLYLKGDGINPGMIPTWEFNGRGYLYKGIRFNIGTDFYTYS